MVAFGDACSVTKSASSTRTLNWFNYVPIVSLAGTLTRVTRAAELTQKSMRQDLLGSNHRVAITRGSTRRLLDEVAPRCSLSRRCAIVYYAFGGRQAGTRSNSSRSVSKPRSPGEAVITRSRTRGRVDLLRTAAPEPHAVARRGAGAVNLVENGGVTGDLQAKVEAHRGCTQRRRERHDRDAGRGERERSNHPEIPPPRE